MEMLIDFRRNIIVLDFVVIKGVELERVGIYKYLRVVFDNGLSWKESTNTIVKNTPSIILFLEVKIVYLFHLKCASF